jgi:hypothetical protein
MACQPNLCNLGENRTADFLCDLKNGYPSGYEGFYPHQYEIDHISPSSQSDRDRVRIALQLTVGRSVSQSW